MILTAIKLETIVRVRRFVFLITWLSDWAIRRFVMVAKNPLPPRLILMVKELKLRLRRPAGLPVTVVLVIAVSLQILLPLRVRGQ